MSVKRKPFQPTLQITISSLFITLIVCVSLVLIWHNYKNTKKIVLEATEQTFEHIAKEVELQFEGTYKPAVQSVELIAYSAIINAQTLDKRLKFLEMFTTALRNVPEMSGLQVGYESGDYFIVRPLSTTRSKELLKAPDNAAFVVDNITESDAGVRTLVRLFFNDKLQETLRHAPLITKYDPRVRPWYKKALATKGITAPAPFLFYFMKEIGITLSGKTPSAKTVIGADITLNDISKTLSHFKITPSSELILINEQNDVLAYTDPQKIIQLQKDNTYKIVKLPQLGKEILSYMDEHIDLSPGEHNFTFEGATWQSTVRVVQITKESKARLLITTPSSELLHEANKIRNYSLFLTVITLLIAIPLTWLISQKISNSLKNLAIEARKISRFDFTGKLTTSSIISEVSELANTMQLMKNTIDQFLSLINSVAQEQNFKLLLQRITKKTHVISNADTVLTYLVDEDRNRLLPTALFSLADNGNDVSNLSALNMHDKSIQEIAATEDTKKIHLQKSTESEFNFLLESMQEEKLTVYPFALKNRQEETIGLLCLVYKNNRSDDIQQRISFIKAFSGFAAVTLESRQLLLMQKKLLNSFIGLLANAIDAKSPYTGGHCQRVPVITKMLAEAACESEQEPFANFSLDDDKWEALHIASWLHDCGKVTTPEYVVDKATKLETIYDRIHEIRTRFEVLKRDAEINYWQQVASGGEKDSLHPKLTAELKQLDDDFTFLAQCNVGGEFMEPKKIQRLEGIAQRTWMRTLDDRLGVSREEEDRKGRDFVSLPVEEKLLADKEDQLIERKKPARFGNGNPWGFKMDVPEYEYNRGELYNLKISRGTLTTEERYKINEHIIQTIIMLEKLPYPKHLRQVPEIAGGHHETMKGNGYPRKLNGSEMSTTARMMVIADIFEALTASDRPYKKEKTLSQSLKIMQSMGRDGHIDPELFTLFLQSGVYLKYAKEHLSAKQIDEVDIEKYYV